MYEREWERNVPEAAAVSEKSCIVTRGDIIIIIILRIYYK